MPEIMTVPPAAITALAEALGLDAAQTETVRSLVTRTDLIDTPRMAALFGVEDQTVRIWRKKRNEALAAGQTLGPKALIASIHQAGQSPEYVLGHVYLWGMQTERLRWDGTVNPDRKLPGRHVGKLPRQREHKDYSAQRQQVATAYRRKRRAGTSDEQARVELVHELHLSRQVIARRILEAEREQDGRPLWADSAPAAGAAPAFSGTAS